MAKKRLTAAEKVERDKALVADRARGKGSWTVLAKKYNVSDRQAQNIWAAHRDQIASRYRETDPLDIVWDMAGRYEQWISDLSDIAEEGDNDAARIGAVNAAGRMQERMQDLLQSAGILPHNLGRLKVQHDVRFLALRVVEVLKEHGVPPETRKALLETLRQPSQN